MIVPIVRFNRYLLIIDFEIKTFVVRDWVDNDVINIHTEMMYAVS
jgi:hypothetical protein